MEITITVPGELPCRQCICCGTRVTASLTGLRIAANASAMTDRPELEVSSFMWPLGWLEMIVHEERTCGPDDGYYYACPTCKGHVLTGIRYCLANLKVST